MTTTDFGPIAPRHCTSAFEPVSAPGVKSGRHNACTAITPAAEIDYNMTAKTAPCFAPYWLSKILRKAMVPADALRSAQHHLLTLTAGPLGVRVLFALKERFDKRN